jgi:hypothetical protein
MVICRHYVRELRRSEVMLGSDNDNSKRSSAILEQLGHQPEPGLPSRGTAEEKGQDQRLSEFLRNNGYGNNGAGKKAAQRGGRSRESSAERGNPNSRPGASRNNGRGRNLQRNGNGNGNLTDSNSNSDPASQSPAHTVLRADIRASAERLLYTYLLRGSEREIVLPDHILNEIAYAIEHDGRDDPEVFDEAKDYVFQAMERDAYPGFLRSKALGNLVPPSSMLRLIIGLLGMFGAFWAGFALIFLDYSRSTRAWVSFF